jgi:hypothetical protein
MKGEINKNGCLAIYRNEKDGVNHIEFDASTGKRAEVFEPSRYTMIRLCTQVGTLFFTEFSDEREPKP